MDRSDLRVMRHEVTREEMTRLLDAVNSGAYRYSYGEHQLPLVAVEVTGEEGVVYELWVKLYQPITREQTPEEVIYTCHQDALVIGATALDEHGNEYPIIVREQRRRASHDG